MSWKGTLALLILAASALIILFFSGRSQTRSAMESLLGLRPSEVTKIIIREGVEEIVLNKQNGIWMVTLGSLTNSVSDRADERLIHSILAQAAEITALDILKPSDLKGTVSFESLDLKTPKRSLTFFDKLDGKSRTLAFGIEGAAKGKIYARLDGDKTVYLIPSEVVETAFLPMENFRDCRLTSLDPDRLEEISLTKGTTLQQLCLKKGDSGWNLSSPMSAWCNNAAVTSWTTGLASTKIDHWMPAGTDPAACGMDVPVAVISAHESGSKSPVTITVGSAVAGSPENHYMSCSDRPGIFIVSGLAPIIEVTPSALRSRQPKPLRLDAVDRIEILPVEQLGNAALPIVISRKKGSADWEVKGTSAETVRAAEISSWIEKLQSVTANSFEPATPEKLESTGFTHPIRIRFIAHLSENTAEEAAGDLILAEYAFGKSQSGFVAFREGPSPDLMIIPESALELTKGPSAVSEAFKR
ncbi:MAG: DUF4340 domain-containing protein [Verrucomicrobiota bacterium]